MYSRIDNGILMSDDEKFNFTLLLDALSTENIVITELERPINFPKIKTSSISLTAVHTNNNKHENLMTFIILPNICCWDKSLISYLSRLENTITSANVNYLMQCRLAYGTIKDQIQNKHSFAGQYVYSTNINVSSTCSNVISMNGMNECILPFKMTENYYGRNIRSDVNLRLWSNRHPNISQLSTQNSQILRGDKFENKTSNTFIGSGTFIGANRDCDGDREIQTLMPYPNSLLHMEAMLYMDPHYKFIVFDKLRLTFTPQHIVYLEKMWPVLYTDLKRITPGISALWNLHNTFIFNKRITVLLFDTCLIFGSLVATKLFRHLTDSIEKCSSFYTNDELDNLSGDIRQIVESGAKGTPSLIESTKRFRNNEITQYQSIENSGQTLNHYIKSGNQVAIMGTAIYNASTATQNVYVHGNYVCIDNSYNRIMKLSQIDSELLFPRHIIDYILDNCLTNEYEIESSPSLKNEYLYNPSIAINTDTSTMESYDPVHPNL
jgi:hypothetical protein